MRKRVDERVYLVLGEDRVDGHVLLEQLLGEGHLVGNRTTVHLQTNIQTKARRVSGWAEAPLLQRQGCFTPLLT